MTTDELVQNVLRDYNDDEVGNAEFMLRYNEFIRLIPDTEMVYSVALNDETRDVRYVRLYLDPHAYEVHPNTVLRTEYVRV